MALIENNTHSFIVKIWIEEIADDTDNVLWRGYITHVSNGARLYLKELGDIVEFVQTYLEAMGVRPSRQMRLYLWLRKRQFFQRRRRQINQRDDRP
jgi:hypothetical protein